MHLAVTHNETLKAIEIEFDAEGVDLLIQRLNALKISRSHLHLLAGDDLSERSPYYGENVFKELIISWIGDHVSPGDF